MDEDIRRFGEQVRALRLRQGWSQDRLGEAAGLNPKYVGELERASRNPSLTVVLRLARALGVEPAELVGDDLDHLGRPDLLTDITANLGKLDEHELRVMARLLRRTPARA